MTALFFSAVCDYCDGTTRPRYFRGYVVHRGGQDGLIHEEYVFRSERDAARWRSLMSLDGFDIRVVHSEYPFRWRHTNGTVKGLELADHLFAVYPDRHYEPAPFRAHIA